MSTNIVTIEPALGTTIQDAARALVKAARTAPAARMTFNDITLTTAGHMTADEIVDTYHRESSSRAAAWEASDEGKAYRAREERGRAGAQFAIDALLAALATIDWTDHSAPIGWLCAAQPHMDRVDVTFDRSAVVASFASHGYGVNVHCGAAFDAKSRDIFARWLIGQALDGIQSVGAPHPMTERFAEDWRAAFPAPEPR